ncbi:MAG: 2-oxoglutarate dehydrogenase complex dihydrolipoyllysine-residue succinyltransferase [Candidatus Sumerlaeaceae bacterium]
MAHEIKVPPVGESVSEGTIAQWLKADGDSVTKGENLVVLDTEKASQDLQAEFSGRLKILVPAGKDVKIGEVIGSIDEDGADAGASSSKTVAEKSVGQTSAAATPAAKSATEGVFPQGSPNAAQQPLHVAAPQPQSGTMQPKDQVPTAEAKAAAAEGRPPVAPEQGEKVASPGAAAEAKATMNRTAPWSFPSQLITPPKQDSTPEGGAQPKIATDAQPAQAEGTQPETREPMSRMRRTIATHLLKASQETAMLTTFSEVDMSAVMALRSKHQDAFVKKHGIKLGFMSFFMKACTDALQKFPLVNASIDGNDVIYHHYVNIAVAVSTERGLAVPVIRDAHDKSFADLEKELASVAERARSGRISLDELKGGTFTITNGGVFGSMMSTPLINPPQVAILGMHTIQERAVVLDKKVEVRPMMYLALSYDHRLIDGKEAVQFLIHVRDHVAAPERLLLGL